MFMLALTSTLVACGSTDNSNSASSDAGTSPATTPSVPTTVPSASTASPFTLSLYTTYDQTSFNNPLTFAETGTTTCQATAANPVVNCTVTVPEGRLYYSGVSFVYSWMPSACRLMTFSPYGYLASQSSTYLAPGATATTDCTQSPTPLACFGGAAKSLVPGFSQFVQKIIYLPDETSLTTPNTRTVVLPSAASASAFSNRQSVNDLPAAKVTNNYSPSQLGGAGDGYVAGSYTNYTFTCRDDWFDPLSYTVNLFINDQDSSPSNPTRDDFYTWKEAP